MPQYFVAILGTLGTLYVQIGNVKVDVGSIKSTVEGIDTQLTSIEADVKAARSDQGQILARVQAPPVPAPTPPAPQQLQVQDIAGGFYVTTYEAKIIREVLKVSPKRSDVPPKIHLWDHITEADTQPLPDDLAKKIGIQGLRYAVDVNDAIALVEPSQNVVVAII